MDILPIAPREYACSRCGTVTTLTTNHNGESYSVGRYNCCPNCPPYAKYPEFGSLTRWLCVEAMSQEDARRLWGEGGRKTG